jgi:hypothetical protein
LKYIPGATAFGAAAEDLADSAEKTGRAAREGPEDLQKLEKELPEHSLSDRKSAAENASLALDSPIVNLLHGARILRQLTKSLEAR